MSKRARTKRLELRADKAAALKAQGHTNIYAWRQVTPGWQSMADNDQHRRTHEFFHHPLVVARIDAAMRLASVQALDNHAKYHAELIEDVAAARAAENWTGLAALQRIRGSSGHYLSETFDIRDDRKPEQLMERLKALLPDLPAEALAKYAVRDSFAVPEKDETKH